MKRLYICGDSYMSPVVTKPKTHFSELLSEKINFDLVPLARGGMSNLGICLQVEHAIKENPEFIILNTTSSDRIEIPIDPDYPKNFSLTDIAYFETSSLSCYSQLGKNDPKLISDTLYALLNNDKEWFKNYSSVVPNMSSIHNAVKGYFQFMYSEKWKSQIDLWCLYSALHKLEISKIPYLIVLSHMKLDEQFDWIGDHNYILPNQYQFKNLPPEEDPGYHLSQADQITIYKKILDHISANNLLSV